MYIDRVSQLFHQLQRGDLSRRKFMQAAVAAGMSTGAAAILAGSVSGQEATPGATPVSGGGTTSITREQYLQQLEEHFGWEEAESTGGEVIMATENDIRTLNPNIASDIASSHIHYLTHSRLTFDSAIDGSQIPDLADYWEISDDGLVYTFYLNQDARFHDGEPVTAEDVVFSFDSVLDETSLSVRRTDLNQVVESYRAVDDHTFEMTAKDTFATTLLKSSKLVAIVPKHIWEPIPFAEWGAAGGATGLEPDQVIGSGPFRFSEWIQNDHVTIERNDDYFVPEMVPRIDAFTLRVTPEASSALQTIVTGESDIAEVPTAQVSSIEDTEGLVIEEYDTTKFSYVGFNMDPEVTPLFVDVSVRQAMMYALDRELVAEQVFQGFAIQADGTQTPLSSAYAPEQTTTVYTYDPERARQLLEEAGWVDEDGDGVREKDGVRFSFEMLFQEGNQEYEQMVPYMQQAWAEIGVDMQPVQQPITTLLDNANARSFDALLLDFIWFVDGDQSSLFRCDAVPPAGFNQVSYCNPEFDALNDQSQLELDPEVRDQLLIDQSNIANDEVAIGMLFFHQAVVAYNDHLRNYHPNGYGLLSSMPWVWIAES